MMQTHQRYLWIILPCFIALLAVTITSGECVTIYLIPKYSNFIIGSFVRNKQYMKKVTL